MSATLCSLDIHSVISRIHYFIGVLVIILNFYGLSIDSDVSISVRDYSGCWTSPFFIAAGLTGCGSKCRWRLRTRCILSAVAACMAAAALTVNLMLAALISSGSHTASLLAVWSNTSQNCTSQLGMCPTAADIPWCLMYLLEFGVGLAHVVLVTRCCLCRCPTAGRDASNTSQRQSHGEVATPAAADSSINANMSSLACAVLELGLQFILMNAYGLLVGDAHPSATTLSGFWGGLICMAAGAAGVAAGRGGSRAQCCIISCLVLSILAVCTGLGALAFFLIQSVPSGGLTFSFVCLWIFISLTPMWLWAVFCVLVLVYLACRAACSAQPHGIVEQLLQPVSPDHLPVEVV